MKGSRDKYNAGFIICDHLFPIIILKGNAPCAYNISFQEINSCLSCYKPMSLNPSLIRVCISLRVLHPHSIIFPFCSHWADVWNHRLVFHTWYMHSLRLDSWWESVNPHCSKFSSWRGYNLFQKNVEDLRTKVHHGDPTQIQTFELMHVWALGQMGQVWLCKLPVSYCQMGQGGPWASREKASN